MIEVEVLINNFKDKENYNKEITVIRNGKEIKTQYRLLQKGDIYKISKERYERLSKKNIVAKRKSNNTQIKEEPKTQE